MRPSASRGPGGTHRAAANTPHEAVAEAHDEMREIGEWWIEKQEERYVRSLEGRLSAARKS
ncbi:hypothetical protein GCM10010994_53140 [Chelatococcus reniformis]|uniref:Uncharacterized protein n=1 Tax=Chelatococcus reniformis TaxID=1494448 RepID=A0A916XNY3_9HYPH|nr:hypothetical protein GCM10010994_53140 [Chelatococcus reniformis]